MCKKNFNEAHKSENFSVYRDIYSHMEILDIYVLIEQIDTEFPEIAVSFKLRLTDKRGLARHIPLTQRDGKIFSSTLSNVTFQTKPSLVLSVQIVPSS